MITLWPSIPLQLFQATGVALEGQEHAFRRRTLLRRSPQTGQRDGRKKRQSEAIPGVDVSQSVYELSEMPGALARANTLDMPPLRSIRKTTFRRFSAEALRVSAMVTGYWGGRIGDARYR